MLKEYLENLNRDEDIIKHDKDSDKRYIESLEKELEGLKNLNLSDEKEIKELECYIDEKKTIYLTLEKVSETGNQNYSELSEIFQERLKILTMLKDIITSYFSPYNIVCRYEFNYKIYLNKFDPSISIYPTLKYGDKNFLLYDRNKEDDFFIQIKNFGDSIESWKNVIEKYTDESKDKYLFTYLRETDYDQPLIIKNDKLINYLFEFPIPTKDKDDQFIRISQNFLSKTILSKFELDKAKDIIFSWNLDESNKSAILFLEFYIK